MPSRDHIEIAHAAEATDPVAARSKEQPARRFEQPVQVHVTSLPFGGAADGLLEPITRSQATRAASWLGACRFITGPYPASPRQSQYHRRLGSGELQRLVEAYKQSTGTAQLVNEYGIHRATGWAHLERADVPRRPARKLTDEQVAEPADRYATGLSIKAVAARLHVDAETLRQEFIRAGVPRRAPGR